MSVITLARWEDHKEILKIARKSEFTKGFAEMRFPQEYYKKGWIGIARAGDSKDGEILGFACVRHLQREPYTSFYYMGVKPEARGLGLGRDLTNWVWKYSPHREIRMVCEKKNPSLPFFLHHGFVKTGMGTNSKGVEHYTLSLFR